MHDCCTRCVLQKCFVLVDKFSHFSLFSIINGRIQYNRKNQVSPYIFLKEWWSVIRGNPASCAEMVRLQISHSALDLNLVRIDNSTIMNKKKIIVLMIDVQFVC